MIKRDHEGKLSFSVENWMNYSQQIEITFPTHIQSYDTIHIFYENHIGVELRNLYFLRRKETDT